MPVYECMQSGVGKCRHEGNLLSRTDQSYGELLNNRMILFPLCFQFNDCAAKVRYISQIEADYKMIFCDIMTRFYKVCLTEISGLSFINKKSVTSISYISNGFTLSNNLITSLDSYISVKLPDNSSLHSSEAHLFPSHEEVNRWSASVQILGCCLS